MKASQKPLFNHAQGLAEYAILLAILVVGVILVLQVFGISLQDIYCRASMPFGGGESCSGGQEFCSDDFSGDLDMWDNVHAKTKTNDGALCVSAFNRIYNQCSIDENRSDYVLDLSGMEISEGTNGFDVFFRIQDNDVPTEYSFAAIDGYSFAYDANYRGGTFVFRKWINGRQTAPIAYVDASGYDLFGEPLDISVDVDGNTFTASVNGEVVLTATEDTYGEGGAGLRSRNKSFCLDNFSLGDVP